MTEEDLLAVINAHRANSLGVEDGELSVERAQALDHYHGRPYGNEVEGRSQVVSRDLAEAVDWAMPGIMRVFMQSGNLAEFRPVGPDDEKRAEQESHYVNFVMMQDNQGFMVLHDVVKDTLLLKNGYTKEMWEESEEIDEEHFTGLTSEQVTMMIDRLEKDGATVEIKEASPSTIYLPAPTPGPTATAETIPLEVWDVKLKITKKSGRGLWMAVPSEEVRVSKKCRGSLMEGPFCEHVTRKTRSDLIELGMDREFVAGLPAYAESMGSQQNARDSVDDESDNIGYASGDRSMDEIEYCEAYLKADWDGDGVAELRRVVTCANQLPPGDEWNSPIPEVALTGWIAKRVPHRHVGESLDDELSDYQEIMTVLKRQLLDNVYLNNNSEVVLNERANLRDFMSRTPGGIKRVRGEEPVEGAVMPLVTKPIIGDILPVLDFFDRGKQKRSGIDGPNTGVDPDVLQQTTKGAFIENLMKASQKLEMIIRLLVESGLKESVLKMHAILQRHQNIERMVQMRGQWVPVNPRDWKTRTDLTVKVGIGTGSEEDKRQKLQMLMAVQGQLLQMLMSMPPPVYAKAYAMFEDIAKTLGAEMPEKYAIAPNSPEYGQLEKMKQQAQQGQGQGGDDLSKAAAIQAQADMQIAQAKNEANAQVQAAKQRADIFVADLKEQHKRDLEMQRIQLDAMNREADRRMELALERMRQMFETQRHETAQQHEDARAAMQQEVVLATHNTFADLGAPGISAGVQDSPGTNTIVSVKDADSSENPPANGEGKQ